MKVKLFWTEIEPSEELTTSTKNGEATRSVKSYLDKDHGSLYHDRFLLEHTEPDLDTFNLEDLSYLEAPLIERLPNKTYFFSFNKLDVERIIKRRPGENVLGIVLEDLALIVNRGYSSKFDVPLPDIEFIRSTSYRHPPRIVQLIAAIHTTAETWPEKHVTGMQASFKKHKETLLKMWPEANPDP